MNINYLKVEKKHYGVKLLMIILVYYSFFPQLELKIVLDIFLNTIIFTTYRCYVLILCSILEILDNNIFGLSLLKYIILLLISYYCKVNLKLNQYCIAILGIFTCIFVEIIIKTLLDFNIDYNAYKIITFSSIIIIMVRIKFIQPTTCIRERIKNKSSQEELSF